MKFKSDVVIVGGGPSGLSLARELAKRELDVCVLERKSEIGESVVCTGIVGKNVFGEFGLKNETILNEIQAVNLVSPGGSELLYSHDHAFAWVVDRRRFDKSLADQTKESGARIMLGTKVINLKADEDRIKILGVALDEEPVEYESRLAVLATGVNGGLQKRLGLESARGYLFGAQMEIETERADVTSIYFGKEIAPGGFAWVVPSAPRKARIGLVASSDARARFGRFRESLGWPELNDRVQEPGYKAIAQGAISRSVGERVLVLGEAAGQVKTTTGGGIYFGLLCSRIAAEAIRRALDRGDCSAAGLAPYEAGWRKLLRREIKIGEAARRVLAGLSDVRLDRLFDLARNDGMVPIIRAKGDFDWHSDLILALLKRLPLSLLGQWLRSRPENQEAN